MRKHIIWSLATLLLVFTATSVVAQSNGRAGAPPAGTEVPRGTGEASAAATASAPEIKIQYIRPADRRGLNMFEAPKEAGVPYTGFQLDWGAAFTQQFQSLSHSNTAVGNEVGGANELMAIGAGFNTAAANLYLNAQVAPGIRVALTTYLSSRHHPDAWVKEGYLLIDESPFDIAALDNLMQYVTLRAGHFEINYGDAHFRRSDNGNAMFNPFVGNYIMDAFTTEVGAEVYVRSNGWLAMAGVTGGEIQGQVTRPEDRGLSFLGKVGFDGNVATDLRVRLTGSVYTTDKSLNNTLYNGDRAGSRYYFAMENTAASVSGNFTSGHLNPGLRNSVTALQLNPFVKVGGLELFGVVEQAKGAAPDETSDRSWNQYAADATFRFLEGESAYVGGRYNTVNGALFGSGADVSIDRFQVGAGWFITSNILMKAEYVSQEYEDFPAADIRNGGKFNGFMMEGVVAF